MRYVMAGCFGLALVPIVSVILLWTFVMAYANPRVGGGEHFPIPTYSLHR